MEQNEQEVAKEIENHIIDKVVDWYCDIAKRYKGLENIDEEAKKRMASQAEAALQTASEGLLAARKEVDEDELAELVEKLIENGTDSEIPDVVYHDNLKDNPDIIDSILDGSIEPTDGLNEAAVVPIAAKIAMKKVLRDIMFNAAKKIAAKKMTQLTDEIKERIDGYIEYLFNKCGSVEEMKNAFKNGDEETASAPEALDEILETDEDLAVAQNEDPYDIVNNAVEIEDDVLDESRKKPITEGLGLTLAAGYLFGKLADVVLGPIGEKLHDIMTSAFEKKGQLNDDTKKAIEYYIKSLMLKYKDDESKLQEVFANGDTDTDSWEVAMNKINDGELPDVGGLDSDSGITDAVDVPDDDIDDVEDGDQEFRKKVIDAIDIINGPAADKYLNLLVEVAKRAVAYIVEHRNDDYYAAWLKQCYYDAAWSAIEGIIDYDDQWLIMRYFQFQHPNGANLKDAYVSMHDDIYKVMETIFGTDEEDEDEEADDQNP